MDTLKYQASYQDMKKSNEWLSESGIWLSVILILANVVIVAVIFFSADAQRRIADQHMLAKLYGELTEQEKVCWEAGLGICRLPP